jgi:protein-S-isoprenylcysteine O-methyltransferase Ste14
LILIPYLLLWSTWLSIKTYPGIESEWNKSQTLFMVVSIIVWYTGLILAPIMFFFSPYLFKCEWSQGLGIFLMIAGTVLNIKARNELGRYFTTNLCIQPGQRLIKTGVYKYCNHPGYVGVVLFILGSSMALHNVVLWALTIAYSVLLIQRIKKENEMLKELK